MGKSDGMAGLAALSAKVKNERRILLERLKAFEKELFGLMDGLGCRGSSGNVTVLSWEHEESGVSGGRVAWLHFNGAKLMVRANSYSDYGGHDSEIDEYELNEVDPGWLVLLSSPECLDSLVEDISGTLKNEQILFSSANEWLTRFVAAEKAEIDADLAEQFKEHPTLLESWQKARAVVESDPEDSIARSSSHLETVLKACLKQLGDTGHETMPVDKLTARMVKKLRDATSVEGGVLQSLSGLGTIFHGVGTTRNSSSTAHGKNEGYSAPEVEVAQLINHLAGAGSAFILKQTERVLKADSTTQLTE
ncbi:abortive infection family protein [Pseudomonas juntendi]|uniref:abortive infection family protein n=1 Tax=Pseudomonas juntendi TaxID=2666183 RepID=UPI001F4313CF|nr:abortive infection family protein [Pseudomonas juntendi]